MGTTLTGTTPATTYDSLIKVTDNGPLSATAKYLTDGLGNDSALALSTSAVGIGTDSPLAKLNISDSGLSTLALTASSEATDQKSWIYQYGTGVGSGTFRLRALNDAGSNGQNAVIITRTGYNVDTHQFLTSGSERMRITSAGSVGIGTSLPTALLTVAGTSDLAWSASTSKLQVSRSATVARFQNYENGSASSIALQWDGGNVGIGTNSPTAPLTIGVDTVTASPIRAIKLGEGTGVVGNGQYIQFSTSSAADSLGSQIQGTRVGVGGASDLRFLTTTTSSNVFERLRILSEGGITFNGDTAAANALDDYEEGTWTPTYSSAGATFTYLGQGGAYTKIGRQVWAQFYLRVTATGTLTNTVIIDGLPFTSLNSALVQNSASVWYTGTKNITPLNGVNSVFINLWVNNVSPPSLLLASDVAGGEYMVGTLTYFV